MDENTFSAKIQQEIDCVGCVSSLHTYLYELSELARNKPGNVLHFEGFVVYGDRSIGKPTEEKSKINYSHRTLRGENWRHPEHRIHPASS